MTPEQDTKHLFMAGTFTLHSGRVARQKVECDALTPADWEGLASMAADLSIEASDIIPVPRGGIPFAEALRSALRQCDDAPVLVVDDVLTTGASMHEVMARYPGSVGLVAFARGPLPDGVRAIWRYENA